MNSQSIRRWALATLTIAWLSIHPAATLRAQSTFGAVRGAALDQSGAALPAALVTLHSVDENSNATAPSDEHGNFAFENIKPGRYSITASRDGFAKATVSEFELTARQILRVDVTLAVAAQAQVR